MKKKVFCAALSAVMALSTVLAGMPAACAEETASAAQGYVYWRVGSPDAGTALDDNTIVSGNGVGSPGAPDGSLFRYTDLGAYYVFKLDLPDDVTGASFRLWLKNTPVLSVSKTYDPANYDPGAFQVISDDIRYEPTSAGGLHTIAVPDSVLRDNPDKVVYLRLTNQDPTQGNGGQIVNRIGVVYTAPAADLSHPDYIPEAAKTVTEKLLFEVAAGSAGDGLAPYLEEGKTESQYGAAAGNTLFADETPTALPTLPAVSGDRRVIGRDSFVQYRMTLPGGNDVAELAIKMKLTDGAVVAVSRDNIYWENRAVSAADENGVRTMDLTDLLRDTNKELYFRIMDGAPNDDAGVDFYWASIQYTAAPGFTWEMPEAAAVGDLKPSASGAVITYTMGSEPEDKFFPEGDIGAMLDQNPPMRFTDGESSLVMQYDIPAGVTKAYFQAVLAGDKKVSLSKDNKAWTEITSLTGGAAEKTNCLFEVPASVLDGASSIFFKMEDNFIEDGNGGQIHGSVSLICETGPANVTHPRLPEADKAQKTEFLFAMGNPALLPSNLADMPLFGENALEKTYLLSENGTMFSSTGAFRQVKGDGSAVYKLTLREDTAEAVLQMNLSGQYKLSVSRDNRNWTVRAMSKGTEAISDAAYSEVDVTDLCRGGNRTVYVKLENKSLFIDSPASISCAALRYAVSKNAQWPAEPNPETGGAAAVLPLALLAVSGGALIVLRKKKRV